MDKALYGSPDGPLVTPKEFLDRAGPNYKEKGIIPYCPFCKEKAHLCGEHTLSISTRFDHVNIDKNVELKNSCPLRADSSDLLPDGVDYARGTRLRKEFFEDKNLKLAYAFCLNMCKPGKLPSKAFREIIKRADKKNIWVYSNIPLWFVPYTLLTFGDFTASTKDGKGEYEFFFMFEKPKKITIGNFLGQGKEGKIQKFFKPSGKLIDTRDNPYEVSEEALLHKAGDISWIGERLLSSLKPN